MPSWRSAPHSANRCSSSAAVAEGGTSARAAWSSGDASRSRRGEPRGRRALPPGAGVPGWRACSDEDRPGRIGRETA